KVAHPPKFLVGARIVFIDGTPDILVYPRDRAAYGRLCQLLTRGKRGGGRAFSSEVDTGSREENASTQKSERVEKGDCRLTLPDLVDFAEGQL
ncbi:hypothetical protein, partial [Serratia marcescens]